jgi:alkane 1-monooxygenase
MKVRALKYAAVFTLPLTVAVSFTSQGWMTFVPILYAFGLIPLVELLFKPDPRNLDEAEKELVKSDRLYDFMTYAMVPIQWAFVVWFVFAIQESGLSGTSLAGRITGLGMLCGVVGINVAHELGHRPKKFEQNLAKALLLSSLYTHFFIEHNRGHHRHVATPNDPATARRNEPVYVFWVRSLVGSWLHAWELERERLSRTGQSFWSLHNEMVQYQLLQMVVVVIIGVVAGWQVALFFVLAALMGGLLLETVNYIEHYGLLRTQRDNGRYERVMPWHSWNADHVVGRVLLFELTRHSDHHYKASKPYPLLDHMEEAPQLPTGYPGMMLLSLVPPLFFAVMNPRIDRLNEAHALGATMSA